VRRAGESHGPLLWRLLPLALLALMLVLGLVIEAVRYHALAWATKLPLAVLLAWGFARGRAVRP
jgi:hypothetical protein